VLGSADLVQQADFLLLVPWAKRLTEPGPRSADQRIQDELQFWQRVWTAARQHGAARIIQVGYDFMTPGPAGFMYGSTDGAIALIREVNGVVRQHLPKGSAFLDLPEISGTLGREAFYEMRRYLWTKQPFSDRGLARLSQHGAAAIRTLLNGPKKVLVLDLDNTLWGGIVGETGPLGVGLGEGPDGEAFRAFQAHCKALAVRGIVLAVCSKNNDPDARGPFEQNPAMVLSLDDIAYFDASWEPKSAGVQRIADGLQLGLDSFVFFDDNPAEREHIRQILPDVSVVEVPPDPADYVTALVDSLWFEAVGLTDEDLSRRTQYQSERLRRESASTAASLDDYLTSLEMKAEVTPIDDTNIERVVQLLGKTNQFNLTTRRHSHAAVTKMLADPRTLGLTVRLRDRFGDHGLIAVVIALPSQEEPGYWDIETWLMSCRVIGRTVEEFVLNEVCARLRSRNPAAKGVLGTYLPTAKNVLVKDLYPRLGFHAVSASDTAHRYRLDFTSEPPARTFVLLPLPVAHDA
jgi:FkbH-like protein